MIITHFYILFLLTFTIVTWGFAGTNFPFITKNLIFDFVHSKPWLPASLYSFLVILFFLFYFFFLRKARKRMIRGTFAWKVILLTVLILFPSFSAFWSHDIFNYMATAKVTFFYRENPYLTMPIEFQNEPLLTFMHAANKVALYGPSWITFTFIPFILGGGNILQTMFAFKAIISFFYLGICWLIWRMSKRNSYALLFFALNPLVVIETVISSHNDVFMMFFALLSFFLLKQKKTVASVYSLIISIFVKYSALFLLPVYVYVITLLFQRKKVPWSKVWFFSGISMYVIFFLSPIREEIYSWYFVWPLTFISLASYGDILSKISLAFSFGLLFRVVPFFYTLNWGGSTPLIKELVTFLPPAVTTIYYVFRKKI